MGFLCLNVLVTRNLTFSPIFFNWSREYQNLPLFPPSFCWEWEKGGVFIFLKMIPIFIHVCMYMLLVFVFNFYYFLFCSGYFIRLMREGIPCPNSGNYQNFLFLHLGPPSPLNVFFLSHLFFSYNLNHNLFIYFNFTPSQLILFTF